MNRPEPEEVQLDKMRHQSRVKSESALEICRKLSPRDKKKKRRLDKKKLATGVYTI